MASSPRRSVCSVAAVGALALVSSGCSWTESEISVGVLDCRGAVERLDELPDMVRQVGTVAAFVDIDQFPGVEWLQRGRTSDAEPGKQFSKHALIARNDSSFRVSVIDASGTGATLDWHNMEPETSVETVDVSACPSRQGTWSVYTGGLWTSAPGCVTIEVSSRDAQPEQVAVPLGTACS